MSWAVDCLSLELHGSRITSMAYGLFWSTKANRLWAPGGRRLKGEKMQATLTNIRNYYFILSIFLIPLQLILNYLGLKKLEKNINLRDGAVSDIGR